MHVKVRTPIQISINVAPARLAAAGVLISGFLFLTLQTIFSLRWPLVHDAAFLHFIAFQIDRFGVVPYAGIYETSLPLVYLFHLTIGKLLGYSDMAFHLVDVVFLGTLLWATWRMMRPLGGLVAAAAVLTFGLLYQSFGPTMTLQRDYLTLLPVALAIIVAGREGGRWRFLLIGALFGLAASIKPHAAIALPPVWLYALAAGGRGARSHWRVGGEAVALAGAGLALAVALPLLWVWRAGGLPAFFELMANYLPLYNQLNGVQQLLPASERWGYLFQSALRLGGKVGVLLPAVAGVVFGLRDTHLPAAQRRLVMLLATLALLAVVYTALAGKFWSYHWMPFFYFAACCGALVLRPVQKHDGQRAVLALAIFVVGLGLTVRPAVDTGRQLRGLSPTAAAGGRAEVMVDFLGAALRPGDTVQPLDGVTGGGVVALLRLGLPSATPYINDTQFYHHPADATTRGTRDDFMARLSAAPPRFLLHVPHASRPSGPGTAGFPELERFLAERYRVALNSDGVIIYERGE